MLIVQAIQDLAAELKAMRQEIRRLSESSSEGQPDANAVVGRRRPARRPRSLRLVGRSEA